MAQWGRCFGVSSKSGYAKSRGAVEGAGYERDERDWENSGISGGPEFGY